MAANPNAAPFVPGGGAFAPSGSRRVRVRSGGPAPWPQNRACLPRPTYAASAPLPAPR